MRLPDTLFLTHTNFFNCDFDILTPDQANLFRVKVPINRLLVVVRIFAVLIFLIPSLFGTFYVLNHYFYDLLHSRSKWHMAPFVLLGIIVAFLPSIVIGVLLSPKIRIRFYDAQGVLSFLLVQTKAVSVYRDVFVQTPAGEPLARIRHELDIVSAILAAGTKSRSGNKDRKFTLSQGEGVDLGVVTLFPSNQQDPQGNMIIGQIEEAKTGNAGQLVRMKKDAQKKEELRFPAGSDDLFKKTVLATLAYNKICDI